MKPTTTLLRPLRVIVLTGRFGMGHCAAVYTKKIMYKNFKHLACGKEGQIYGYLEGSKTGYDRSILRLEENLDVNKMISEFGGVASSCQIEENDNDYMLIKVYK